MKIRINKMKKKITTRKNGLAVAKERIDELENSVLQKL